MKNPTELRSLLPTASSTTTRQESTSSPSDVPPPSPQQPETPPLPPEFAIEVVLVTPKTIAKNAAMFVFLMAFVCGVFWFSLHKVGQAGTAGSDDPLSVLREEAETAKEKHRQEEQSTKETAEILEQFQAGAFDQDKYEDLEEDEVDKKPWYKFW
jgi:hypothetical protein